MPKSFGLEVFSFGSRPTLIETELEFGQGMTYQDESRPGKWRGDDSIQGEKLGEKESSAQKLGDTGGEGNGAERGQSGNGFSRFVNGNDSGRFQTRREGVRVPGPVKKRKKEELCWFRQVLW